MTKRAEKRLRMKARQEEREKERMLLDRSKPMQADITSGDGGNSHVHIEKASPQKPAGDSGTLTEKIINAYDKNLKKLEIIPIILLILAVVQLGYQMSTHNGDFITKDISLKGGITLTISVNSSVDTDELTSFLLSKGFTANIRSIESNGKPVAILIESDVSFEDNAKVSSLISVLKERFPMTEDSYSLEGLGSSMGQSFFKQTMSALIISFVLMSVVVAISFFPGKEERDKLSHLSFWQRIAIIFTPSAAVILAAFSDILMTVATVNVLGVKVSSAGIAAFIMLIGYSVDTDILLTTRVLRKNEGTIMDRIISSARTGILTSGTAMIVSFLAMVFSTSDVIRQIMLIIFIGMIYDQINTWIQNAGIIRSYAEKKERSGKY